MSKTACPRSFEVEALRDGRLTGGERASFERHLTACTACASEVAELDALAAALHQGAELVDELHERRERVRLLAAFDAALVKPKRAGSTGYWLAAAALVMCAIFGFAWRQARTRTALAASVSVHAESLAVWTAQTHGSEERVRLENGSLRIHVDHALGETQLIVSVPDGELEDIGTTFVVDVANGRTTRVTVDEGRVLVRLRDQPAHTVKAGETWSPEITDLASSAPAAARAPALAEPPTAPPQPAVSAATSVGTSAGSAAPTPRATAPDAAADFRAAMTSLSRGDNRQAEQMLATFLQKHPRDPHAEDAAYSRVIALQRCGDTAQLRQAAAQYLARYPAGFRRTEVAALAH